MKTFVLALLSATVIASLLSALLLAVAPALSRRYSARAVSAAFLIVLLSFLTVWSPKTGSAPVTVALPKAQTVLTVPVPYAVTRINEAARKTDGAEQTTTATPAKEITAATRSLDTYDALFILWAAGALAALALHALKHARFLRAVRRWKRPAPDAYRRALNEAAYDMRLRRIPGIAVCPVVDGPMLYGIRKPCVLVPAPNMPIAALKPILRHELMHYRRRDLWRRLATLPVLIIEWFNPLAYFAARGQAFYAEVACDERATAGESFTARKDYAQVILYSIRGRGARSALSTGFKGGKKQMKKRIETVLSGKTKRVGTTLICMMLCLALLLSGALALTESQSDPKEIAARAKTQYMQEYGDFFFWPAAVKGAYANFCEEAGIETDDGVKYLWWEERDIQYADAMNIVRREMGAEDVEAIFYVGTSIYLKDDVRVLKIELKPKAVPAMNRTYKDCDCTFLLEAATGRVISASMAENAVDLARGFKAELDVIVGGRLEIYAKLYGVNQTYWPLSAKAELCHAGDAYKPLLSDQAFTQEVPGTDDLSEAQAREIADNYFKETFGMLPGDVPGCEVKCGVTFLVLRSDPTRRCYVFSYASDEGTEKYVDYGEVSVLSPSGEISNALYYGFLNTHALETTDEPRSERAKRQYTDEYGDFFFWPASIKAAYTDRCEEEGKLPEDGNRYLDWDVTDIREEDIPLLIRDELGLDEPSYFEYSLGILEENGVRFYLVKTRAAAPTEKNTECTFKIATPTGKILEKIVPEGAVEAAVEALEKQGNEQQALFEKIAAQYGDDQMFWPLSAKAEYAAYMNPNPTIGEMIDSLPTEADLTLEEAVALADAKFEEVLGVSPKAGIKTDHAAYEVRHGDFFYAEANDTGRYYRVLYIASQGNSAHVLGSVWVVSPGGEIMTNDLSMDGFDAYEEDDATQKALDAKTEKDGMWVYWPTEEIREYGDALGYAGFDLADEGGEGQISRDTAVAIARQYILEKFPQVRSQVGHSEGFKQVTKESIDAYKVCALLVTSTESTEAPYWQIILFEDEWLSEGTLDTFDIRINAATGAVEAGFEPGGNG